MEELGHGSNPSEKSSNETSTSHPGVLAKKRIVFGEFEFFPASKTLNYQSAPCHLEPKMLDLLAILIEARPNLVSKDELMDRLWPDSEVSDWSLARLVSDTRKLIEDSGKAQSIIKTVRGKGFTFVAPADEIFDAYSSVTEERAASPVIIERRSNASDHKPFGVKLIWISSLVFLILAIGIFYLQFATNNSDHTYHPRPNHQHQSPQHKLEIMREVQKNLRLTYTTHLAQQRRRDDLVELLDARFPQSKALGWEEKFHRHFAEMNASEKFLFEQIRAMTAGSMYQGNKALFDILEAHSEIYQSSETFPLLYNHLNIWLNKFERVFRNRQDMCVVYVGEEDGVPFPSQIDGEVDLWINKASKRSAQE